MVTKTCGGCGWVYPSAFNESKCRFCGWKFKERVCAGCGELCELYQGRYCRDCYYEHYNYSEKHRQAILKLKQKLDDQFNAWVSVLKSLPFIPLTEEQWLEACRYFGGCALCDTPEIEARAYFIRFEDGGRYTAWNIIPLCEKCATVFKRQTNPFKRFNTWLNDSLPLYRGVSRDKFNKVVEYLQERMDKHAQ